MKFTGLPLQTVLIGAAVVAAAVTVLYVLKLRKRRIEVPFSGLWQRVLDKQRQQSNLWRRLRRLLSWLVYILLVGLLAFGLLDPKLEYEVVEGRHIALLIDNSASMTATDVTEGKNRLDVAREKALELLETVGPEDRIMLATFSSRVHPRSPFVGDANVLEQPLRQIEPTGTGTEFERALSFAADSLRGKDRGELVIMSDGAGFESDQLERVNLGDNTRLRHVRVGETGGNLAITAFNVRRYVANKLDYELFAGVRNYFDRPIRAELQIFADGRMVDRKKLELEPGETKQQFYPSQAVSGRELEAEVEILSRDASDKMPIDDHAYALLPKMDEARVQLVTPENLYLEGALRLNPNVSFTRVTPEEFDPSSTSSYDVTIFDQFTPQAPEEGNFVYIDPSGDNSPWRITGSQDAPIVASVKRSHPLMRWVTLKDLNIGSAKDLQLGRGDVRVVSSVRTPLIVARSEGERQLVGFSFDVRNSDLPLRVAFPMLMFNIVDYFALDDESYVPNYRTGRTWSVELPEGIDEATVVAPDGSESSVPVFEGDAVFRGVQPGFYDIRTSNGTVGLAANLSDPVESDPTPTDIAVDDGAEETDASALFFDRRDLWIWAVLAAALVLLVEWFLYNRRITV